jgi:type I restriction enzyme S subunit
MIADLKPYPECKESGQSWLGQVPEHWKESRVKNLAKPGHKTFVDGDWIESPFIREAGIRLIQTGNIGLGAYREKGFRYIDEETFQAFGCTDFQAGDVLICRLGDPVGRACLAPDLGVRMITSVDVCILKTRQDVASAFVVYVMSAPQYLHWVGSLVRGSTRDRVSRSMLGGFMILLPPPSEQAAIVRFLDWANGRLERAIRAKRKVIALLHEQKQAIIHRAVTRGLDPNVRLKPSGVEWLGDVPEHWDVRRLRNLAIQVTSGSRGWSSYAADSGSLFIRIGNLTRGSIDLDLTETVRVNLPASVIGETARTRVAPDDVLLSITAFIGSVAVVPVGLGETYVSQHVACCRLAPGTVNARWVGYVLLSPVGRTHGALCMYGGTKQGLSLNDVRNHVVLLPPLSEQDALVERIETEVRETGATIRAAQREISLLREFRTRLIADVVTGKLDVREAAAHLPEETGEPEPLDETDTSPEDISEETETTDPDATPTEAEA